MYVHRKKGGGSNASSLRMIHRTDSMTIYGHALRLEYSGVEMPGWRAGSDVDKYNGESPRQSSIRPTTLLIWVYSIIYLCVIPSLDLKIFYF